MEFVVFDFLTLNALLTHTPKGVEMMDVVKGGLNSTNQVEHLYDSWRGMPRGLPVRVATKRKPIDQSC